MSGKRLIVLLLLGLCPLLCVSAKEHKKRLNWVTVDSLAADTMSKKELRNYKAKMFFKNAAEFADDWFMRGLDTNYVALPKHRFKLAYSSDVGNVFTSIKCTGVPYYESLNIYMHSNFTPKMGFQVGYRNLSIGYQWNLFKGYNNFKIGLNQSAFGLEFNQRKTAYAHGFFDATAIDGRLDLQPGDMNVNTISLSGWFALNRRRFSMPAAVKQSFIQRHSAGSILIYASYSYWDINVVNEDICSRSGGLRELELYQASAGIGYGYNYTPNRGKILLHISGGPMIAFLNKMIITGDSRLFLSTPNYNFIFSQKINPEYPVYLTGQAKVAFVWNISELFYLSVSATGTNTRFLSKDNVLKTDSKTALDYNPEIKMRLNAWDWNAVFYLGIRFL